MTRIFSTLISGLIFGLGLIVSGMINPAKVQNFLDLAGDWDPSLAFVMAGAIAVTAPGFLLLRKTDKPLFELDFQWPTSVVIDKRLVAGAAIFGVGWGLGGLCPGPAITGAASLLPQVVVFVLAMLVGMKLVGLLRSG